MKSAFMIVSTIGTSSQQAFGRRSNLLASLCRVSIAVVAAELSLATSACIPLQGRAQAPSELSFQAHRLCAADSI
jgi:hypothetical protein